MSPETVLKWQQELINKFLTFNHNKPVDRPLVLSEIKELIVKMKKNITGAQIEYSENF